jgi:DNA-binding IclR family transcriptional regulator
MSTTTQNSSMTPSQSPDTAKDAPGIQSIEVGADILRGLAEVGGPVTLTRLSKLAGMEPSKARRYLVSYLRCGMVEQDEATGQYMLGPLAFQIGLASFHARNPIRLGVRKLTALRDATGETALLSVWGDRGPTIVGYEESRHPVMMVARLGATLPLLTSATGLVFAAFQEFPDVSKVIREEWESMPASRQLHALEAHPDLQSLLMATRARRLAIACDRMQPGVCGLSVPVFSHNKRLVAALTLIVRSDTASSPDGKDALSRALIQSGAELSKELGFAGTQ